MIALTHQNVRGYFGDDYWRAEHRSPSPVPQRRPHVINIPLVSASGTGKVSSTVKANATGVMGTTVAPIMNIEKYSTKTFFKGRV